MKDHAHDDQIALYGLCLACAEVGEDATTAEPARQLTLAEAQPDGDTYTPALDRARLGAQAQRVLDVMLTGAWHTLAELAEQTHDPEASISARIRDLRKPAFGGHTIDRRHRGDPSYGQYEYRMVPARHPDPPNQEDPMTMTDPDQKLPDGSRCGIHGDDTTSGRCASCDAEATATDVPTGDALRITHFRARNIRRIEAVEFSPGDGLVKIGGANGAGKTSVLDSILLALGGAQAQRAIADPLRHGTTGGEVELTLGDSLIVTRSYDASGKTKLKVRNVDGTPIPQQQTFLDSISGALQFDSGKFLRGTPAAQRDALLQLPMVAESLTIDPDALAAEREAVYGRRTEANREVKRLEALLTEQAAPEAGIPKAETDPSELRAAYRDLQAQLRENDAVRQQHAAKGRELEQAAARVADLERQLEAARAAHHTLSAESNDLAMRVGFLEDPDVTELERQMDEVETLNGKVRAAAAYRELEQKVDAARGLAGELDRDIEAIDRRKDDAMAKVRMPIDGLTFDDEGVVFQGVPLAGASGAEKLRVCASIAVALNPDCRVLCIPDASLLDSASWAMLAEMADRERFQVFAEVVDEQGDDGTVFMEDGILAAQPPSQ